MLPACSNSLPPSTETTELTKSKPPAGSRFDIFTNIFRKKHRESESDPSEGPPPLLAAEAQEGLLPSPLEPCPTVLSRTQPVDIPAQSSTVDGSHIGGARTASRSPVSPRVRSLERDMEILRQSRQDNPYLQHQLEKLSLQHDSETQETTAKRKDWPAAFSSPRRQDQERLVEAEGDPDSDDAAEEEEPGNLHQHLIRSPPPMFPLNVSQFTFPEASRSSQAEFSPPKISPQQVIESRNNHNNNIHHHPALKPKGSLPLISFEELNQQSMSSRGSEGSPSISPGLPSPTPQAGSGGRESVGPPLNGRAQRLSQGDLNPLLIKSGVDALDPSMRKVLDFQRHGLLADPSSEFGMMDGGRRSVDLHQRSPLTGKLYSQPPATGTGSLAAGGTPPPPTTASTTAGSSKKWSSPPATGGVRPFGTSSCSPTLPALDDPCRDPTLGPVKGAKPPPCPAAPTRSNYWEY